MNASLRESDQERSRREWAENWAEVSGAPDLATVVSAQLWRARGFAANYIQREHLKAQRGENWNRALVASMEADLYGIEEVLRARGEIGSQVTSADADEEAAAPRG